jgi:hypothetical protein
MCRQCGHLCFLGDALTADAFHQRHYPPTHLQVRVSYIEIYLEKIKDLLNPAQDNLNVREGGSATAGGPQRGVWIEGYPRLPLCLFCFFVSTRVPSSPCIIR